MRLTRGHQPVSSRDRSSQFCSGKIIGCRSSPWKTHLNQGLIDRVTWFLSRLTFFFEKWIAPVALRIQKRTSFLPTEMYRHAQYASLVIISWMPYQAWDLLWTQPGTELPSSRLGLLLSSALRRKGRLETFHWKKATDWTTCKENCRALITVLRKPRSVQYFDAFKKIWMK